MYTRKPRTLVIGLGNVLMGDEGIGVFAVEYLRGKPELEGIDLLDGGTGGFHLLSLFDEYDHLILIDAAFNDGKTGEVKIMRPKFAADLPRSLTTHDIGLRDLVQTAELLDELPDIHLITVNVEDVHHVGMCVSQELAGCLDQVYMAVLKILGNRQG
jgi:hydrogenase maturation protease